MARGGRRVAGNDAVAQVTKGVEQLLAALVLRQHHGQRPAMAGYSGRREAREQVLLLFLVVAGIGEFREVPDGLLHQSRVG